MPDFTVDPDKLDGHATSLTDDVAPAYGAAANDVRTGSEIGAPGFGLVLSFIEAVYIQRVDFLAKDLDGAQDVVTEIGERLHQTAEQYRRAENLHIEGFGGTPTEQVSYGDALGQAGLLGDAGIATAGGLITLGVIYGCSATLGTCAGLCPTFIPAAVAALGFISDPLSIAEAGSALIQTGQHVGSQVNAAYQRISINAASGWEGAGRDNFDILTTTIKGHLDIVGKYLETLGAALHSLALALAGLWVGLLAFSVPFLVYLISMRLAQAFPPAAPALEVAINSAGALISSTILTVLAGVAAVGGLVVGLINGLIKDVLSLGTLPDNGDAGVPDMTEFTFDGNFETTI